jgi:septin family protein
MIQRISGMILEIEIRSCITNSYLHYQGESGLGKSTFINTLFTTLLREYKKPQQRFSKQLERTVQIDVVRAGKGRPPLFIIFIKTRGVIYYRN